MAVPCTPDHSFKRRAERLSGHSRVDAGGITAAGGWHSSPVSRACRRGTATAADAALDLTYEASGVFVLGVAAYGYDRTDSLLVPAVAYLSSDAVHELPRGALTAVWMAQFM